jgi:hypothetical protein
MVILEWMGIQMLIGQVVLMIEGQLLDIVCLLEEISCHGEARKQHVVSKSTAEVFFFRILLKLSIGQFPRSK